MEFAEQALRPTALMSRRGAQKKRRTACPRDVLNLFVLYNRFGT